MLHAREDYQPIQDPRDESVAIPDDEPVFLLRAQDISAPETVRHWVGINRERFGAKEDILIRALDHADKMEAWQEENGCKTPDL